MEKEVEHYTKNKDNKKGENMMYIKLNKKQLINKVVKLTKDKNNLLNSANSKNETIWNQQDDYDNLQKDYNDMVKVKESIQLQNQTLEKRLLATEVELLRKIVSLYEKQPIQQPIVYNYPNNNELINNGVSATTNAGTNSTMITTYGY